MRQTVALVFLLLPMMAAGSQPQGTYQRATIQAHDGVPCLGVPDTRETRAAPPIIAGVTVTEVGKGHPPVWQRIFLREGSTEPALGPGQCLPYGQEGEPALGTALRAGKHYRVVVSGYTPGTSGTTNGAEKRVFSACFYMVEAADAVRPIESDCSTASSAGMPLGRRRVQSETHDKHPR